MMRFITLCLLLSVYVGSSVACDLDHCSTEYTSTFVHDPSKGCRRLDGDRCNQWRSYHACLLDARPQCVDFPLLFGTREAEASRIIECYCEYDEGTTSDAPFVVGSDFTLASGTSTLDTACRAAERFPSYTACVLFGDPHLVTLAGREETCCLSGRHRLLEYDELSVDTVNVRVDTRLKATGTSEVIVRYGASSCTEHSSLQYSATASDFRAFFDDGSSPEHLIERRDDNLVVLKAAWLGITIRVRRTGIYLTVAIQLPSAVQDEVGGLCFTGCPSDELLEYKLPSLSAQVVLPHVARYACDHVEEDTFFFQSCVFDLVMTGDRNFTVAALEAKKDVEDLQAGLPVDSAAERVTRHGALVVVLALMSLLLTSKIDEFV
ncbi:repulsive guidance molecule B-like [Corticium candelabrum]|uniref:repulsive guidance molecule B-like n=1 Tax=Corticium candelabrum TaxID=121492 RepID=UPI002E2769AA|nr:repulsive guidance molecule B-like [Corticium candelabrum]